MGDRFQIGFFVVADRNRFALLGEELAVITEISVDLDRGQTALGHAFDDRGGVDRIPAGEDAGNADAQRVRIDGNLSPPVLFDLRAVKVLPELLTQAGNDQVGGDGEFAPRDRLRTTAPRIIEILQLGADADDAGDPAFPPLDADRVD